MKLNHQLLYIFTTSIMFLTACSTDELPETHYPRVETLPATEVSEIGATLNGEILAQGTDAIVEHGFVYGFRYNPNLTSDDFISTTQPIVKGSYSLRFEPLESYQTYYVRAFARNENIVTYGPNISFQAKR